MKTIHQLSTAELRNLESAFAKPKSLTETIMLAGIRAEIIALHDESRNLRGLTYDDCGCEHGEFNEEDSVESIVEQVIGSR